jgi:hypothetical protein
MPVSPPDLSRLVYVDALLELARAARAFAAAMTRAADAGERLPADNDAELATWVLDECRGALLPALTRAPGMLQLFTIPTENANHGMASDAFDDLSSARPATDQGC